MLNTSNGVQYTPSVFGSRMQQSSSRMTTNLSSNYMSIQEVKIDVNEPTIEEYCDRLLRFRGVLQVLPPWQEHH